MPRPLRIGLIQAACPFSGLTDPFEIRAAQLEKHRQIIEQAALKNVQVLCLQELFYSPYFCAEQSTHWYRLAEPVPQGPLIQEMQDIAQHLGMVLIVPIYEVEGTGVYYNSVSVIDADGQWLGKTRKNHIPQCAPGFWEKFYFRPGNLGYPVFQTLFGKIGILVCYDRHFPEAARCLGLHGAELVFNPSATVSQLSEYLWHLEQPAHAVANQYFIAAVNRVGLEAPWNIGEFYGQSYICDPRGQKIATASRDQEELLIADIDLDQIREVRDTWQFYRDRRPESYGAVVCP